MSERYLYIGDELTPLFEERTDCNICLFDFNLNHDLPAIRSCSGIIILTNTEEVYEDHIYDDDNTPNGFRIAQELRLRDVSNPILFVSYESREECYDSRPSREIINVIGHDFAELPLPADTIIASLSKIKALDELELYDVQNSCCRKDGIINELIHKLDSKLNIGNHIFFEETIRQMAMVYKESPSEFLFFFNKKYSKITAANIDQAVSEINTYGKNLISIYGGLNAVLDIPKQQKLRAWSLLWVDDEHDGHEELFEQLSININVIRCSDAVSAIELLNQDWQGENRISVLLADYRLYHTINGLKIQQAVQGYKLISEVAKSNRIIGLGVFSALPKQFLFNSLRRANARIFSKSDYLRNKYTRKLLCDELLKIGDENYEALQALPDVATGWRYLESSYKQYRHATGYLNMETELCERALSYVDFFNKNLRFMDFMQAKKTTFKEDKDPLRNMLKLQDFMLARRLAIWLSVVKRYENKEVVELLKGEAKSDYSLYISQSLGLRLTDFPLGLTIEERNWFQHYLGIPIYKNISLLDSLLSRIAEQFRKFAINSRFFLNLLQQDNYLVHIKIGDYETNIFFDNNHRPALKSLFHVRGLYHKLKITLTLPEKDIHALASYINVVLMTELMGEVDPPFTIRQTARFFKAEVSRNLNAVNFTKEEKKKIVEYLSIIRSKTPPRLAKSEFNLFTNVLLAFHNLADQKIDGNDINAELISHEIRLLLQVETDEEIQSRKLGRNNVYESGSNKVDRLEY